jgi:hypothetical protein
VVGRAHLPPGDVETLEEFAAASHDAERQRQSREKHGGDEPGEESGQISIRGGGAVSSAEPREEGRPELNLAQTRTPRRLQAPLSAP